jgi:hypothetical protein
MTSKNRKRFSVRASWVSSAPPEAIFSLVKDSSTYPQWTPVQRYEMERPGIHELHGLGEIRVLITGPLRAREEIVNLIPNRYMAYTLIGGLPMCEYLGETTLDPLADGGTRVTWQSSFYEKYPFTGWFWKLVMLWVLRLFVRAVSRAAENNVAICQNSSTKDGRRA